MKYAIAISHPPPSATMNVPAELVILSNSMVEELFWNIVDNVFSHSGRQVWIDVTRGLQQNILRQSFLRKITPLSNYSVLLSSSKHH
jgi:hypothetical protein